MQKIRVGDTVQVVTGADRGKRGEVLRVEKKAGRMRVVVERINIRKKHQRPVRAGRSNTQAGIIEFEAPIDASNVMLVCPHTNEPTRVGFRIAEDGRKVRVSKKANMDIDK
ncbi:MAG: 50S ribosomal protein L24 [Anaerolineae bacterium]|nr:50S ribosomal protein L24 [Anaerolineae bacterium]